MWVGFSVDLSLDGVIFPGEMIGVHEWFSDQEGDTTICFREIHGEFPTESPDTDGIEVQGANVPLAAEKWEYFFDQQKVESDLWSFRGAFTPLKDQIVVHPWRTKMFRTFEGPKYFAPLDPKVFIYLRKVKFPQEWNERSVEDLNILPTQLMYTVEMYEHISSWHYMLWYIYAVPIYIVTT